MEKSGNGLYSEAGETGKDTKSVETSKIAEVANEVSSSEDKKLTKDEQGKEENREQEQEQFDPKPEGIDQDLAKQAKDAGRGSDIKSQGSAEKGKASFPGAQSQAVPQSVSLGRGGGAPAV